MIIGIDKECKLILYTDDSKILFSHKDPVFISQKLGLVLECCSEWLVDNKLLLHLGKTRVYYVWANTKSKQTESVSSKL